MTSLIFLRVLALLVLVLGAAPTVFAYNMSDMSLNFPTAYTKYNKILGMILAYNMAHVDPLNLLMNEYVSMCEGGWEPHVVIFTTNLFSDKLKRYFRQRSYCYRRGDFVNVTYSIHDQSIGTSLAAEHRKYMSDKAELYDVFLYHEDDIVFKYNHLAAYLNETITLHNLLPTDGLFHNVIGFQRFRRIGFSGQGDQDIFEQEMLEEVPNFRPLCIKDKAYLLVEGNTHQAIWIFTKQQVLMLDEKCGFLKQLSASREFMSSFSVYDRHLCGLNKLMPGDRFQTFNIWHYYQGRHVSWIPTFQSDENIRAGYQWSSNPRARIEGIPACWHSLVKKSLLEQNETVPDKLRRKTIESKSNGNTDLQLNKYIENDSENMNRVRDEYNLEFLERISSVSPRKSSRSSSSPPVADEGSASSAAQKLSHEVPFSTRSPTDFDISSTVAMRIIWKNLKNTILSIFS